MLNSKAQASLEILIIIVIIISLAFFNISNFYSVRDSTIALAMFRSDFSEKLYYLDSSYFISDLKVSTLDSGATVSFSVSTAPNDLSGGSFSYSEFDSLVYNISESTSFSKVNIFVNGDPVSSIS